MDASLIKKKETLTHERIRHDLKSKPLDIGNWILSWLLLLILAIFWWLSYHSLPMYIFMIPATLFGFWLHGYVSYLLYHDICAKKGHYRLETHVLDGVAHGRQVDNYSMVFSNHKRFAVLNNCRYYTWSDLYCLSSTGVARTYAARDDVFYLVMHGNAIVMAYNTKLFELEK